MQRAIGNCWQNYEKREDFTGAWSTRYDISQEYDKVGNRTRFDKNVVGGYTSSYGESMDLSYTYDVRNNLSAIDDADDSNYTAVVTTDANMNITEIDEQVDTGMGANHLYSYFDVDDLNRVTAHRTKSYNATSARWEWLKREHGYDAAGRLVNSTLKQWNDGDSEPAGLSFEHIYDRGRLLQNYDGSSSYGDEWRWAGAQQSHSSPLKSPNADTASQTGYNIANDKSPQRYTYLSPSATGNERHLYGQGKPQAKNSSGSGANWYQGTTSEAVSVSLTSVESRLFFEGTVTASDMSRATDAREKGRIGITGSAQAYAGSYGRVTSEAIGRDINPLGRGGGAALVGGMSNVGIISPRLPGTKVKANQGNSVNNWTGTKTFTQCSDMNAHDSICSSWEEEIEPKMLALQTSSSSEKCKNYSAGILDCYNKCLDKAKSLHLAFMEFNCEEADRKVDDLRRQEDQLKRDLKEIEDKKSEHGDCLQEVKDKRIQCAADLVASSIKCSAALQRCIKNGGTRIHCNQMYQNCISAAQQAYDACQIAADLIQERCDDLEETIESLITAYNAAVSWYDMDCISLHSVQDTIKRDWESYDSARHSCNFVKGLCLDLLEKACGGYGVQYEGDPVFRQVSQVWNGEEGEIPFDKCPWAHGNCNSGIENVF